MSVNFAAPLLEQCELCDTPPSLFRAGGRRGTALSTSTVSASITVRPHVGVLDVVGMSLRAVRLIYLMVVADANDVLLVRRAGIPAKVREVIVRLVTIKVAALQPLRRLPDERLQHQAVDKEPLAITVSTKVDHEIAGSASGRLQYSTANRMERAPVAHPNGSDFRPDSAVVGNGVETLVFGYSTPFFVRHGSSLCEVRG